MSSLIWIGSVITLMGLAGLVYCIVLIWRAKREGLADETLRKRLQSAIPINMGAMFLSVIGLMLVVVGIVFG